MTIDSKPKINVPKDAKTFLNPLNESADEFSGHIRGQTLHIVHQQDEAFPFVFSDLSVDVPDDVA